MSDVARSLLTGTLALTAVAIVALWLTARRLPVPLTPARLRRLRAVFLIAIGCQLAHFAEEIWTGFSSRFPEFLGLERWPTSAFATLNLLWFAVWLLSAFSLQRHFRLAVFPAWFLGLASVANGVAHPLIALSVLGYFPGLWTAPLVFLAGILLLRELVLSTDWKTLSAR